jgi:hypothetical protein
MLAGERLETPEQWIHLGTVGFSPRRDGRYLSSVPCTPRINLPNTHSDHARGAHVVHPLVEIS